MYYVGRAHLGQLDMATKVWADNVLCQLCPCRADESGWRGMGYGDGDGFPPIPEAGKNGKLKWHKQFFPVPF